MVFSLRLIKISVLAALLQQTIIDYPRARAEAGLPPFTQLAQRASLRRLARFFAQAKCI
jgi:hypothetical protein